MLLAGRKGQHEAALPLAVHRFAAQAPRHLADEFLLAGEQANIGAAEVEADADRLAFADDDVRAHFARAADRAQRHRFGDAGDQQPALLISLFRDRQDIGDVVEDVGILYAAAARYLV